MFLFCGSFWVSVFAVLYTLFGFFPTILSRIRRNKISQVKKLSALSVSPQESNRIVSECVEAGDEEQRGNSGADEIKDKEGSMSESGEESPKFCFKFEFQTETFEKLRSSGEIKEDVPLDSVPSTSTSKYEFVSGKDFSCFVQKPEDLCFNVRELYADSDGESVCLENKEDAKDGVLPEIDLKHQNSEKSVLEEKLENFSTDNVPEKQVFEPVCDEEDVDSGFLSEKDHQNSEKSVLEEKLENFSTDNVPEKQVFEPVCDEEDVDSGFLSEKDHQNSEKSVLEEKLENSSTDNVPEKQVLEPVCEEQDVDSGFLSEKDLIGVESDVDSSYMASSHENNGDFLGSISDGFLSDIDFEETFELDLSKDFSGDQMEELIKDFVAKHEDDNFEDEDNDIMDELRKLEESEEPNSHQDEVSGGNNDEKNVASDDSKKPSSDNPSGSDSDGFDTLWEHQDLLEQLKMELKKVRASGLPTILEEESECPKIMEDLKPWKIDEKFQQVDRIGELHKFYKSYRERMRKLDILNYQKMYAIGFFQSKDPLQSFSTQKSSSHPAITSLLPQNLRLGKSKKLESDPTAKFIRELHTDLEAVYVGQMCLSWEILHWQLEKAIELWESDHYSTRRYNEVAGEFQQFQVLVGRFIEDERFEGPRVQNYAKKRCVLRNLLQVPVIREDKVKGKGKAKDDYAVTSDILVEIVEESIRIFWRFVRTDKDATVVLQKSRKGTQIEPLEPNDLQLLAEVQTALQKKDKKLKELLRSGNCILRKCQRQKEENSDHVLYFFSQVDMKLVARVLNMSKVTTDQLLWCRSKLNKINFVNKRIHVEPSFLLFPS